MQVRAGFAVFGCGFYELTSQQPTLFKMPPEERESWMKYLDAGRRAPNIRAAFFTAGAANDFFFWPPAVQATLDAIPGEKNHLFAPNANHKVPAARRHRISKTSRPAIHAHAIPAISHPLRQQGQLAGHGSALL